MSKQQAEDQNTVLVAYYMLPHTTYELRSTVCCLFPADNTLLRNNYCELSSLNGAVKHFRFRHRYGAYAGVKITAGVASSMP